jgi:hypothetical protein
MKLAAHQINFLPWIPFFRKMQLCDKFVLMENCQYEKNGFLNRCNVKSKWWTLPIKQGNEPINEKFYLNGYKVKDVNIPLIYGFARMFGIDTKKIVKDVDTKHTGTQRIIDYCKAYECSEYLTNPEAEDKYLDVDLMKSQGIKVIPFIVTNDYKVSLFEALEKWGIEGTRKMIWKQ